MRLAYALAGWTTLALVFSAGGAAFAQATDDARLPKQQYLNKDTLLLGFTVPAPDAKGLDPAEIQLHVSDDQGRHWRLDQAVKPGDKRFIFKAPHDGEYWFMLRTRYEGRKQLFPAGPPAAQQRALVDTVPPVLEVTAQRGEGGEIHVHWHASDLNLEAGSLKLDYREESAGSDWRPVALDTPPGGSAGDYVGEIAVVPQGPPARITLRAVVADLAKNSTTTERLVPAPQPPAEQGSQRRRPKVVTWNTAAHSRPAGRKPDEPKPPPDDTGPSLSPEFPEKPTDGMNSVPRETDGMNSVQRSTDGTSSVSREAVEEEIPTPPRDGPPAADGDKPPETPAEGTRDFDAGYEPGVAASDFQPPGVHPHSINGRRFEMDYDVVKGGSSGVAKVELWATRDGGRNWESFGEDDDCQSPILIEVDDQGTYGFRVVIENGAGRRDLAPKPGETPDIWVRVDLTPPRAGLLSAEQGAGEDSGDLMIAWEADDEQLAARPISLAYSDSPGGPWTMMASGLENTGNYVWRLDRRVAEHIYLRLEVRDEAGNITTVESPEPIALDRARPQGRIRDVRPLDEAARRPGR